MNEVVRRPCIETIFDGWHFHLCSHKGLVERNGKWYCGQHDPVARAEKAQIRHDKWQHKFDGEMAYARRIDAMNHFCEELSTEYMKTHKAEEEK